MLLIDIYIYIGCACMGGGVGISLVTLRIVFLSFLLREGIHELVDFLGRGFKVCEASGGCCINSVIDSSYYNYRWEDYKKEL